jgi:hypothetical protein
VITLVLPARLAHVTISGKEGDDAKPYQERQITREIGRSRNIQQ